ncbi:MAG: hypothetical protein ACTSUB_04870 [Candidatus Thorarchaeota archaeon]
MPPNRKFTRDEIFIFGVFVTILAMVAILIFSGEVWVVVPRYQMSIWIIFGSVFVAMIGGVVATYSFVAYMQKPETRHIVLGLLGFDIIFIAFAFLFTHPSSELWIPFFPDRQRNRSIVMIFGMALIPSVLSGAFRGEVPVIKEHRWLIVLWGTVIVPVFVFWFSLSPEPVLISTDTSDAGGLFSATAIGAAMLGIVLIAFVVSFIRYLIQWFRKGDRIILGSGLALIIWIISLVLLGILNDPLLTLEIVWYTLTGAGFLILALTMIVTAIIEPHKALNEQVAERTQQLELSERESEFYLDLWSHKIGNILQGMQTYLELISQSVQDEKISSAIETAKILGKEANIVNRQVINLAQIKKSKEPILESIQLLEAIETAVSKASQFQESDNIIISVKVDPDVYALADNLIDLLFLSLILNIAKRELLDNVKMDITSSTSSTSYGIQFVCSCKALSPEGLSYLSETGLQVLKHLGLELFTVKLLLARYNCTFQCLTDKSNGDHKFTIHFPKSE